jgi:hypothetical protein
MEFFLSVAQAVCRGITGCCKLCGSHSSGWDIMLRRPLKVNFIFCLPPCWFLAWPGTRPIGWRLHIPPKRRSTFKGLLFVTSQNTEVSWDVYWMMNWKDYGEKGSNIPAFVLTDWGKPGQSSIGIIFFPFGIQTGHLLNTRCFLNNLVLIITFINKVTWGNEFERCFSYYYYCYYYYYYYYYYYWGMR